jgi:hypothetical protein
VVHPETFVVHPETFAVYPETFVVYPETFVVYPETFAVHPETSRILLGVSVTATETAVYFPIPLAGRVILYIKV